MNQCELFKLLLKKEMVSLWSWSLSSKRDSEFFKRMSRIFDYFKTIEMITYETDVIILASLRNQIDKRIETLQKEVK